MLKNLFGGLILVTLAFAGLAHAEGDKGKADQAAMMEKYKKLAAPGEQHKWLARAVGKWDATVKMTMGPGAAAQESKATAEFTSVLDGRYLREDVTGNMMGQPFHGTGYFAFDNFKQQFVSTWIDDAGTGIMVSYGTAAKDGKSVTLTALMDEPMTGEKNKKVKQVMRWADDNTMVFEMWDSAKGKEWKALEITYTRAK